MRKRYLFLTLTLVALFGLTMTSCTESQRREIKSVKSNFTGGLNRTVTVYDYNGKEIKSWTGRFDVKEIYSNGMYFDTEDGKRVIINGGIIINEEK